ncbi:hemolysin family protein [Candidatus Puniceispirillum marinum]|jgi:CBS domain containing-hemolysin-like protein|uniref:CBS domain protein n=1 Tax=Puniceispirillum marinum (strain IMCC1322) TaxID=488538 RepID=D5BU83_PUNMI|nr:hemolysin family protein [Candidatus Puniceispirillum marinum]ADE39830.1 CBS domain protein [Candidatus Puniceispirillum marinum IMCC1322]
MIDVLLNMIKSLFERPESRRQKMTELLEDSATDRELFDRHEGTLLRNLLGLRDKIASDVMIPRADIVSVSMRNEFSQISKQISQVRHSRIPVYRETLDDVAGFIHVKDIFASLQAGEVPPVKSLLRPALFVAPTIRLLDLLHEMRLKRRHLALVVDEFGGVDGLITIEDLIEEIVGDIEDEYDETIALRFDINGDGTAIADARLEIETLETVTGILLDDDDRDEIDTLGGLVCAEAGRVPTRGEIVRHAKGLQFEVLEGDPRRITLVKIRGLARVPQHDQS